MNAPSLTPQQQSFVALASCEATGDLAQLRPAIEQAFANGLTVNQIKEVFSHLYAYTGFPRSLNALGVLQTVLAEREQAGIATPAGAEASPLPADYNALQQGTAVQTQLCGGAFRYDFCPAEDYYLKAHLFGDIFARDVLTHQQRELVTVSALAAMQGTEPQLHSHQQIAQRAGVPQATVEAATALARQLGSRSRLTFAVGNANDAYAQYFVGQSYLAPLTPQNRTKDEKTVLPMSNVTFEPACRNNWHIHHGARQILICVSGKGWYQEWGKPAIALNPGDVIDIPEGVKHWHGAQKDSWFQHIATHVAVENTKPGSEPNEWLEPVTDEQYNAL